MGSVITLGLAQIKVGAASTEGEMPHSMEKIGKTYKDTCKISQEKSEITEHYEEGHAAPAVRKKTKKMPKLTFSMMNPDVDALVAYIGGEKVDGTKWGYSGTEVVANKAILVETESGLNFEIPNGDIEATLNGDISAKGLLLVDFEITPMEVAEGKKPLRGVPKD